MLWGAAWKVRASERRPLSPEIAGPPHRRPPKILRIPQTSTHTQIQTQTNTQGYIHKANALTRDVYKTEANRLNKKALWKETVFKRAFNCTLNIRCAICRLHIQRKNCTLYLYTRICTLQKPMLRQIVLICVHLYTAETYVERARRIARILAGPGPCLSSCGPFTIPDRLWPSSF